MGCQLVPGEICCLLILYGLLQSSQQNLALLHCTCNMPFHMHISSLAAEMLAILHRCALPLPIPSYMIISSLTTSPTELLLKLQARFMDAVVKVYCVHSTPNFSLPWQRSRQYATTSTGFMVEGGGNQKWLLTNAHSVEYHSQVGSLALS